MNANNNATATEKNRPGRQTGFRLKFTIPAQTVREGIAMGFLSGRERMTIINRRKRSQEEVMAILTANPAKMTDPEFMAGVMFEETESGKTLREVVEGLNGEMEIARVDISNHYDVAKAEALSFLAKHSTKDES